MVISLNIKIIYDGKDEEKRRTCYWLNFKEIAKNTNIKTSDISQKPNDDKTNKFITEKFSGNIDDKYFHFEFMSVKEFLDSDYRLEILDLFKRDKTDIIIINFDSINGDLVYGSFEAYQFFNIYIHRLNKWVQDGGILILEAQTVSSELVQSSYDIFTKAAQNSYIKTSNKTEWGKTATIDKNLVNQHPILRVSRAYLKEILKGWKPNLDKKPPFPVKAFTKYTEHNFNHLYAGYFDKYSNDWEPLIYADNNMKKPIMLCNIVKKVKEEKVTQFGAYILTTMYIGRTGYNPIVKNLLNLQKEDLETYKNKKEEETIKAKTKRNRIIILIIITLIFIPVAIYYIDLDTSNKLKNILYDIIIGIPMKIITGIIATALLAYFANKKHKWL